MGTLLGPPRDHPERAEAYQAPAGRWKWPFEIGFGAFMQNVGAAWLMVSLGAGPMFVALTQTAALPYFLLTPPAGSAGDIVDRCKLILFTESRRRLSVGDLP